MWKLLKAGVRPRVWPSGSCGCRSPGATRPWCWRGGSCASLEAIGGEGMRSRSRSPPSRFWRKRSLTPEEGAAGARSTAPGKRGRGRPITTGEYAGLARAKAELNAQRELELQAEAELAAQVAERSRGFLSPSNENEVDESLNETVS
ncbi:hypothetical protein RR48_02306 [Papilio machaon]|uniref:Uncharacterized protein n=1 Tax=Papilio machaon TaxID=76193 RepID=A0A0N1ICK6_PAPMA|nr:hypothetical protein RR48_02306 [Papilio machaon]